MVELSFLLFVNLKRPETFLRLEIATQSCMYLKQLYFSQGHGIDWFRKGRVDLIIELFHTSKIICAENVLWQVLEVIAVEISKNDSINTSNNVFALSSKVIVFSIFSIVRRVYR